MLYFSFRVGFSKHEDKVVVTCLFEPGAKRSDKGQIRLSNWNLTTKTSEKVFVWEDLPFNIVASKLSFYEVDVLQDFVALKYPYTFDLNNDVSGGRRLAVARFDGHELKTAWTRPDDSYWSVCTDRYLIRYLKFLFPIFPFKDSRRTP